MYIEIFISIKKVGEVTKTWNRTYACLTEVTKVPNVTNSEIYWEVYDDSV